MQSFFWHVLDSAPVYESILREIEEAAREGTIPVDGNISWNEAQNLPYFQACLKEAMRVRPAVGLNITRLVPPEGTELEGLGHFPGGTSIAVNGWVLHRDKEVFGQDADVFRPERWLEDEERARRMERYMFQVSTDVVPVNRCGGNGAWWLGNKITDKLSAAYNSLEAGAISALAATSRFSRSTRSFLGF